MNDAVSASDRFADLVGAGVLDGDGGARHYAAARVCDGTRDLTGEPLSEHGRRERSSYEHRGAEQDSDEPLSHDFLLH